MLPLAWWPCEPSLEGDGFSRSLMLSRKVLEKTRRGPMRAMRVQTRQAKNKRLRMPLSLSTEWRRPTSNWGWECLSNPEWSFSLFLRVGMEGLCLTTSQTEVADNGVAATFTLPLKSSDS